MRLLTNAVNGIDLLLDNQAAAGLTASDAEYGYEVVRAAPQG